MRLHGSEQTGIQGSPSGGQAAPWPGLLMCRFIQHRLVWLSESAVSFAGRLDPYGCSRSRGLQIIIDWSNILLMPRVRDEARFKQSRESLLAVGQDLFINSSFNSVGLNDILRKADIPKGSFYHYFTSKEDFGMQVIELYSRKNLEGLEAALADESKGPYERLESFFQSNIDHFAEIDYCQGCLMANLSQELADVNEKLRCQINELMQQMVDRVASALAQVDKRRMNLGHLSDPDAALLLMNSWQGAIMKMKLQKSAKPLLLFMAFFFSKQAEGGATV
jgi:TetR/AcrR family transcriptional repressor of nem operon